MAHVIPFETVVVYDAGVPGISIDVELSVGDSSIFVSAKVDTGSDRCIFSKECGDKLGLQIETGEPQHFGTVTGVFLTYGHPVTLTSAGYEFDSTVYFAAAESFERNVLGRFGWLDRMIIGINDYDGKLYLSSYK